jgi:hypothetical protein
MSLRINPGASIDSNIQLLNSVGWYGISKFGRSTNVDSGFDTDIWDGSSGLTNQPIWLAPTAARIHAIGSGNVEDTSDGDGAQVVRVYGLDANWDLQEEDVELSGVTPKNTIGSYIRIFRMRVTRTGVNGFATDDIIATAAVDSTVTAVINTPSNSTLMAIYTIPADHKAYLTSYYGTMNKATPAASSGDMCTFIREGADVAGSPWVLRHIKGLATDAPVDHLWSPYLLVPEKTDIKLQLADGTANDMDISAGFGLFVQRVV